MADLDPALQDSIDNLQTRHTALVNAVRNHSGGSIAQATNDLLAARDDVMTTVEEREKSLLGLVQANSTTPVPSLLLDFKNQVYMQGSRRLEHGYAAEDLLTFRREGPKWVVGSQGTLVEIPADTISYHYDPVTGEPLGVLSEESRTNILPDSNDFSTSTWEKDDVVLTASAIASPDGKVEGWELSVGAEPSGQVSLSSTRVMPLNTRVTDALYFKANTASHVCLMVEGAYNDYAYGFFDLVAGEAGSVGGFGSTANLNPLVSVIEPLPGGWYRCLVAATTGTSGSGGYRLYAMPCNSEFSANPRNTAPDVVQGDSLYIWQAQAESGGSASSTISTSGAPVTRAADSLMRTLGEEFNPAQGTLYIELTPELLVSNEFFFSFNRGANRVLTGYTNAIGAGSVGGVSIPSGTFAVGMTTKLALSYKDGTVSVTANGIEIGTYSGQASLEGVRVLWIGRSHTASPGAFGMFNGTISDARYFPLALTATEREALTA